MSRFLLDSGPANDFVNRQHGIYERAAELSLLGHTIGICTPVLGELWAGAEGSQTRERNLKQLERRLGDLLCWPYDKQAAREFGRLMADLRRRGRPMQQIDVQIAAIARLLVDCTVVSMDTDFSAIPGLKVENWRAPTSE